MIINPRIIPRIILKLQALLPRLLKSHPKRPLIEKELKNYLAGYRGEKSLDYHLSLIEPKSYLVFHTLRLKILKYYFQIDSLIITPYFLLVLETKNIYGELFYDHEFKQLIRTNSNGKKDVFEDPIQQVKNQVFQLEMWIDKHKVPEIPIVYHVVNANSKSLIQRSPGNLESVKVVIQSNYIREKFQSYKEIHQDEKLSKKDLRKLTSLLQKHNTPSNPDILKKYEIPLTDISTGVHCPKCQSFKMIWSNARWVCPSEACSFTSKTAHYQAIRDYGLLINTSISNEQLMTFLHLDCRHKAKRILTSMNFPTTGERRWKLYHIPDEFLDEDRSEVEK